MSLPVKDVADAMGEKSPNNNVSHVSRKQRQSMTINHSQMSDYGSSSRYAKVEGPSGYKLPSANVNEDKLKMILKQLKKVDRDPLHTSR